MSLSVISASKALIDTATFIGAMFVASDVMYMLSQELLNDSRYTAHDTGLSQCQILSRHNPFTVHNSQANQNSRYNVLHMEGMVSLRVLTRSWVLRVTLQTHTAGPGRYRLTPPLYPQAPPLYSQQPCSIVSKVAPVLSRAPLWPNGTAALALH
jgi:hypothetical protein